MNINEFDYHLPENLIAQYPADKRDASRLMVLDRAKKTVEHKHFYNILDYVNSGDCLVLNNSKVIPARLFGVKEKTGAKVEFLLTKNKGDDLWETMVKPGKRLHPHDIVSFSEDGRLKAEIIGYGEEGTRIVKFIYEGIFLEILEELGKIPLPPYIDRETDSRDRERYQTVYCKDEGSVA
ncbi:MAG: S-adenosylmethionine:tRNA ribosyltransferase-isomerase, partial [Anaerovorax sp.]